MSLSFYIYNSLCIYFILYDIRIICSIYPLLHKTGIKILVLVSITRANSSQHRFIHSSRYLGRVVVQSVEHDITNSVFSPQAWASKAQIEKNNLQSELGTNLSETEQVAQTPPNKV